MALDDNAPEIHLNWEVSTVLEGLRAAPDEFLLLDEQQRAGMQAPDQQPPSSTAVVGEPGTLSESIGSNAEVPAACAAVSGAITPSISPLPKLSPRRDVRLAIP